MDDIHIIARISVVAAERAEEVDGRRVDVVLVGEPLCDRVDVVLELAMN